MIWDEEKLKNEIIGDYILTKLSWNYSVGWWGDIYSYSSADFGKMKWNENICFDVMRGICEAKSAVISASKGANCRTCNKTSSIEFKVFSNVILIFQHFLDYKINCEKKTKYFQRNFPINYQHHPFRQQSYYFPSSILSKPINFQRIFHRSSSVKRRRRKANFFFMLSTLPSMHQLFTSSNVNEIKFRVIRKHREKKTSGEFSHQKKLIMKNSRADAPPVGSFPWRAVKLKNKFHKYWQLFAFRV